ncbi:unnamed protein product [Lepidochelys kempii]
MLRMQIERQQLACQSYPLSGHVPWQGQLSRLTDGRQAPKHQRCPQELQLPQGAARQPPGDICRPKYQLLAPSSVGTAGPVLRWVSMGCHEHSPPQCDGQRAHPGGASLCSLVTRKSWGQLLALPQIPCATLGMSLALDSTPHPICEVGMMRQPLSV